MPVCPALSALIALTAGVALAVLSAGCTLMPPAPVPAGTTATAPTTTPGPGPGPTPAAAPAPLPAAAPAPLSTPPAQPPSPTDQADAAARRLLAFHERVRELGPADMAREVARLGEPADPAATLELALVLAQTRQNGDLARALTLVEPQTRNPTPWQGLARLLHARLSEQRRMEDLNERHIQQLRDQQRRLDQLASQIDALRAIERSLSTRPAAPAAPK